MITIINKMKPSNGKYWTVGDVDRLPLDELFTPEEIEEKREQLRKSISKSVDRIWKAKFGDKF